MKIPILVLKSRYTDILLMLAILMLVVCAVVLLHVKADMNTYLGLAETCNLTEITPSMKLIFP